MDAVSEMREERAQEEIRYQVAELTRLLEELTRATLDFERLGEEMLTDAALEYQRRVAMALPLGYHLPRVTKFIEAKEYRGQRPAEARQEVIWLMEAIKQGDREEEV
jgi:hypothetical protein